MPRPPRPPIIPLAIFHTTAGVAVYAVDLPRKADNGRGWRVACARMSTGNFHGNLNLAHLASQNGAALKMKALTPSRGERLR